MPKPIIELRDISKKFSNKIILNHVNLTVYDQEILGVIGPNGSGKTTLLKMIIGFLRPDSGSIIYKSKDITNNQKKFAADFGFATQENSYYPNLTTEENIRYFGQLYNISRKTIDYNVKMVLNLVKLNDSSDVLAKHLSTGMQRRLDIACSLINNPKILILDEPTEDLDIMLRKDMLEIIKRINSNGTTIIMTSHLFDDIQQLADRVAVISKHTIIKQGPLSSISSLSKKGSLEEVFAKLVKDA